MQLSNIMYTGIKSFVDLVFDWIPRNWIFLLLLIVFRAATALVKDFRRMS